MASYLLGPVLPGDTQPVFIPLDHVNDYEPIIDFDVGEPCRCKYCLLTGEQLPHGLGS